MNDQCVETTAEFLVERDDWGAIYEIECPYCHEKLRLTSNDEKECECPYWWSLQLKAVGRKNRVEEINSFCISTGQLRKKAILSFTMTFEEACGRVLRGARYREGLTQRELAKKTGLTQRQISDMENGKRPIHKEDAKILANVLNAAGYKDFL